MSDAVRHFRPRRRTILLASFALVGASASPALAREGIGDRVFHDVNNNGVMDAGEPGIPGVTVTLDADNGSGTFDPKTGYWSGPSDCVRDGGDAYPQRTTVTNADGAYYFPAAGNGGYIVTLAPSNFVDGGPLVGFTSSTGSALTSGPYEPGLVDRNDVGDDNKDHGTATATAIRACGVDIRHLLEPVGESPTPGIVLDTPDESQNTTIDFGVFKPATVPGGGGGSSGPARPISWRVGDRVWNDLDRDGIQDPGEPGLRGVSVNIFNAFGAIVGTVTSGKDGAYALDGVLPGDYRIGFSNLPLAAVASPAGRGGDAKRDSDVLRRSGKTPLLSFAAGAVRNDVDAGFVVPTAIAGLAWRDADADGRQDVGERGVRRLKVSLVAEKGGKAVAVATTNSTGRFRFVGIKPGVYRIAVKSLPAGLKLTRANRGSDLIDSDVGVSTGRTRKLVIGAGQQLVTVGIGLRK